MHLEGDKMMGKNYLKERLSAGKPALGTWCVIGSPAVADIIASSGLDFLVIDAEHGPISYETAQQMAMACESRGVSPIMRVGKLDDWAILRALDIGVHGIQLPEISTAEDAKEFVKLAKYPPIGTRGFSPYTRAGNYDVANGKALPARANANILLIANVEGVEGIRNLDAISKVEHIDVVFIGLFDLSKSLGIPGDVENPLVSDALAKAVKTVKKNGKKIGSIATNLKMLDKFMGLGIDYVTYGVDAGMLKESYKEISGAFSRRR